MSISYEDLSLEVASRLRINSTDRDRFKVQDSLNHAQRFLINSLDKKYLNNAIRTIKGKLLKGEPAYQLPTDFVRHIAIWISYTAAITAATPGKPATVVGEDEIDINNRNKPATTTYPQISYGAENGFELRPIPSADQTNGWRMRYIYLLPDINSSQNCMLKDNLKNLLVLYASSLSAMVDGYSEKMAAGYLAEFNEELKLFLPKEES